MERRALVLSAGAALVTAGAYGVYTTLGGGSVASLGETLILPSAAQAQTAEEPVDLSRVLEMELGNPDAAVTVIEFASFTCPHCATFHSNVYPRLKADYIDTGLIRFVYREVYFDAYGLWAAMVARCGGQMRYFGVVDMLYDDQREWSHGEDANVVADNLRRIGRRAGMTDEQLGTCLGDRDTAMALMQTYQNNVEEFGVRGTPSFVINNELHTNLSFAEMQAIIDPLLSR